MSIRPVDFNGMLQRTEDVGYLKHNEDVKPLVDQQNIQHMVREHEKEAAHQVQHKSDNEAAENQTDAREESKGQYFGNSSQRRNQKEKQNNKGTSNQNRIIKKGTGSQFDITI